jgi:hypothetical protein
MEIIILFANIEKIDLFSYRWEEKQTGLKKMTGKIRRVEKDTYCTVNDKKDTDRIGLLKVTKHRRDRRRRRLCIFICVLLMFGT